MERPEIEAIIELLQSQRRKIRGAIDAGIGMLNRARWWPATARQLTSVCEYVLYLEAERRKIVESLGDEDVLEMLDNVGSLR